jgi:hypothetical protein
LLLRLLGQELVEGGGYARNGGCLLQILFGKGRVFI